MITYISFFFIIQFFTKIVMNKINITYKSLTSNQQIKYNSMVVSLVHSIISSYLSTRIMLSIEKNNYIIEKCIKTSLGYFIWDILLSYYANNIPYIIHGSCCTILYYLFSTHSELRMYGCFFLLYEWSSIFINVRWLITHTKPVSSKLKELIPLLDACFFIFYVMFRLLIGIPVQYNAFLFCLYNEHYSTLLKVILVGCNISLGGLNVYWFKKIINRIITNEIQEF